MGSSSDHGGAKKSLWGRHFMLWGMWEKVKTVGSLKNSGELKNPWGSHFVGAVTEGCILQCKYILYMSKI